MRNILSYAMVAAVAIASPAYAATVSPTLTADGTAGGAGVLSGINSSIYANDSQVGTVATTAGSATIDGKFTLGSQLAILTIGSETRATGGRSIGTVTAGIYDSTGTTLLQALTVSLNGIGQANISGTIAALAAGNYIFRIASSGASAATLSYYLSVTTDAPIPGAALLFGAGLSAIGGAAARKRKAAAQAV
jgi:hypothetical protein